MCTWIGATALAATAPRVASDPHRTHRNADSRAMEGLAAVQQRMTAIEGRFTPPSPTAAPVAAAAQEAWRAQVSPNFESFYRSAIGSSLGGTPALRLQPGQYGRVQPPREFVAFGNGRIPPAQLVTIGHGEERLYGPAADAFQQMERAARADGAPFGVFESYRDLPAQQQIAREKGLYSEGGLAATPGSSNHGWGLSVDLDLDPKAQTWMRENGWRFGFAEDVPREPWHWTYRPS